MAATTSMILGGAGALMGGVQALSGNKTRRDNQRGLNSYDRQVLDNAFENIPINTAGSDLLREQGAQTTANMVDAVQNGGSRSIIGGLPKVAAYTNDVDERAARMLDSQYDRRNYAAAGDDVRIQNMTEARDNANINALSSQVNAGRQDTWNGIMGVASGLAYAGRNITPGAAPDPATSVAAGAEPNGTTFSNTPSANLMPQYPATTFNPNAANYPATADAPIYNPSPYFDFANSYQVPRSVPGPSQYNPFSGFPSYFNPGI